MERIVQTRKLLLFLGDIFLLYLSLFGAVWFGFGEDFSKEVFWQHFQVFSIFYPLWLIIIYTLGFYELNLTPKKIVFYSKLTAVIGINAIIGIIFFYLIPALGITPKTNLMTNVLFFGLFFWGWRAFFYYFSSAYFLSNVGIVGINSHSQNIAKHILDQPFLGYKLKLFIDTSKNPYSSSIGTKIIAADEDLLSNLKKEKIDILVIAEDAHQNQYLAEMLYGCLTAKIDFLDLPRAYETIIQKIPIDYIGQAWFLENLKEGKKKIYNNVKKVTDLIVAIFLLLIAMMIFPFVALAIKCDSKGPVFYRQTRIGKGGKPFTLIKFRSMKDNAETQGAVWAEEKDSRLTKIGAFLRKSHIDELPQIMNIIKGDIGLVGPRPERPEFVARLEKEIPHYQLRHIIKPGFTGWAQIKFRYARSMMDSYEKFQYDLYYLKNRSLLLDLGILLKTFNLFFKQPSSESDQQDLDPGERIS